MSNVIKIYKGGERVEPTCHKKSLTLDFIDVVNMLAKASEGRPDYDFIRSKLDEIKEHLELIEVYHD